MLPRYPFLWLSIVSVTKVAAARMAVSLFKGSSIWLCQKHGVPRGHMLLATHTEHNLERHDNNWAVADTQGEAGCCVIRLGWQAASTVPVRESKVRY
jgi:hypothetical protein